MTIWGRGEIQYLLYHIPGLQLVNAEVRGVIGCQVIHRFFEKDGLRNYYFTPVVTSKLSSLKVLC